MNQNQNHPGRAFRRRILPILIIAVLLISGIAAYAVLRDTTSGVKNTFTPATVSCEVVEDFSADGAKSNVVIRNKDVTTNVPALMRAKIVINWVDEAGNILAQPTANDQYSSYQTDAAWVLESDGYYYYKGIVPVGGTTAKLIDSVQPESGADHKLQVEIIAEAIQAAPAAAADEAWGRHWTGTAWEAAPAGTSAGN